ncbi:Hint domain-containing protein [Phaeobacter sp.]|uniref:Hint domain-containing protein n=1 Tax=Phaeobacter sp. TaxID=1902409 RepID=UPI0025DB6D92|nr:Hint domain-containing protein [Phaeobacter sp.]
MAIGEAGSITTNSPTENQLITIDLEEPLTNPVFALSATNNGGNQFVLRVVDQTLDSDGNTTSFSFIIEEWEYHDGAHPATETINWLAVEEGVHTLPDGRIIEAGTSSVSSTGQNTGGSATFNGGFTDPPVVLTSVMSNNDTTTVDSDPSNITASGFDLTLQEEEAQDGVHGAETIGWVAIEPGGDATSGTASSSDSVDENTDVLGLGATFGTSVVLAETQTINGGDTATVVIDGQTNSTVGVFVEEEQSANDEVNHVNETVGIVAFEDGLIPCFTHGTEIDTPSGAIPVERLQIGDLVNTVDHGPRAIRWIGRCHLGATELARQPQLRPVRIMARALGQGLPRRDLWVSRQHRMYVSSKVAQRMFGQQEILVAAIKLTALPGIYVDETVKEVIYTHLLLDDHELLVVEGAKTESLYLGAEARKALSPAAREEIAALFPALKAQPLHEETARLTPQGRRQKQLISRHRKNNVAALM